MHHGVGAVSDGRRHATATLPVDALAEQGFSFEELDMKSCTGVQTQRLSDGLGDNQLPLGRKGCPHVWRTLLVLLSVCCYRAPREGC